MDKKIFTQMLKQAWYYILAYFTHYLTPLLKEVLEKTKNYFIELLWNTLKEEFHNLVEPAVEYIENYFQSASYEEKEKDIINTLFKNATFPVVLRPFKPLIKKILQKKLHELIKSCIEKVKAKL